jgi:hypothetical protein
MTAENDTKRGGALDEAAPAPDRDLLGRVFFWLHFAVMLYILVGWAAPSRASLIFYEFFLPVVTVQWWFNQNSCVLNNLESKIRTGTWRNPANPEEGAWLLMLLRRWFSIPLTPLHIDFLTYSVLAILWAIGLWRLS